MEPTVKKEVTVTCDQRTGGRKISRCLSCPRQALANFVEPGEVLPKVVENSAASPPRAREVFVVVGEF